MTARSWTGAAVLLFVMALPAAAQQPPAAPRQPGVPQAPQAARMQMLNVELALRMKDQLKLTDAQFSQLDAIRKEIVAERQQRAHDMIDVQSRIAAGLVKPEDVRKQFAANRDQLRQVAEQRRDRIAKILTTEQQDQLRQAGRRMAMRRMMMQRRGMGQGFGRGFGRGGFGRGFGPGMRQQFGPGFGPGFAPGMRPRRPMPPAGPGFDDDQRI